MDGNLASPRARILGSAAGIVMISAACLAALSPLVGATATTGVWIFPHDNQADAVADSLSSSFYIGDNSNPWLKDSFFADSLASSADVQVDLYNPTSSDLTNVQLFAAINDSSLFTDIKFSGGSSGDVTVVAADLSGGTPFLSDGSNLPSHDIYPAYFTSYGVGDLKAGSANIKTLTVKVSGDFAGGLVVHLDYSAEDGDGVVVTGPFEADMSIFENGEASPACVPPTPTLSASTSDLKPLAGEGVTVTFETNASNWTVQATGRAVYGNTTEATALPGANVELGDADAFGPLAIADGKALEHANFTLNISKLLLPGDEVRISAVMSWEACNGTPGNTTASLTLTVGGTPAGSVHTASWWQVQFDHAAKGKGKLDFTTDELTLFLERAALHSTVFMYGPWNGVGPGGGCDGGWVDIGSFSDALAVLKAHDHANKMSNKAERELLALWLNVASGALNLDTPLKVPKHGGDDDDEDEDQQGSSPFQKHTGLQEPGSAYDTPGEIIAFASLQLDDWKDGSGASKADLKLAKNLCMSVNKGWLVAA